MKSTHEHCYDCGRQLGPNSLRHFGVIDFNDRTVVQPLFEMININADALISQPKRIQETYDKMLSEPAKEAISRRDKGTP